MDSSCEFNFPPNRVMFEVSETESIRDCEQLKAILRGYRRQGRLLPTDDFGSRRRWSEWAPPVPAECPQDHFQGHKSEPDAAYLRRIDIDYQHAYLLSAYPGKPCVSEKVSADQALFTTQ